MSKSIKMLLVLVLSSFLFFTACSVKQQQETPQQGAGEHNQSETQQENERLQDEEEQPHSEPPLQAEPSITKAKLLAVGDILISGSIIKDATRADGGYDFRPMFEYLKSYIQEADIAIANQETIIGGEELGLSGYPRFNSPFEVADAVVDTGFHVATLANNHTLDRDELGVLRAREYWDSLDIITTGAFVSAEDRNEIRIKEVNDIDFAILNYTYGTNGIPVPTDKEYLVNLIDEELIAQDIELAKELADVVIVALHWGNEYEVMPNEEQKSLAQFIADHGVHMIIGTHPHVLQPPAWVEGREGNRTFVAYSLGNFLSSQDQLNRLIGGVIGIEVTKVELDGMVTIELDVPTFYPTYNYYSNWRGFKLYPLDHVPDNLLPNATEHYENIQKHMRTYIEDLEFIQTEAQE